MPIYDIHHIIPLTPSQEDELAEAITRIHSTRFSTPRLFVNVKFTDTSRTTTFVAGKRRKGNIIVANVRTGPARTKQDWDDLCLDLVKAWDEIVPMPKVKRSASGLDYTLRAAFILGGMEAGYEAGFLIPPAGGDVAWLKENMEGFEKKAEGGDEDFVDLVKEIKDRGFLEGVNGKSG